MAFTMDGMAGNLAWGGSSASGPGRPRVAWIRIWHRTQPCHPWNHVWHAMAMPDADPMPSVDGPCHPRMAWIRVWHRTDGPPSPRPSTCLIPNIYCSTVLLWCCSQRRTILKKTTSQQRWIIVVLLSRERLFHIKTASKSNTAFKNPCLRKIQIW